MHKKGVKSSTKLGAGNKPNPESELEMHINKYLQEIAHSNADLAPHLAELKILSATEVE